MNQEDILKMMRQQFGQGNFVQEEPVPVEKLEEFIQKVRDRDDETLYTLGQRIVERLNHAQMISFEEVRILPQVLQLIETKIKKGEK